VFGRGPRLAHGHQGDHPHPLRRQFSIALGVATLLAVIALLLLPPHARANFVYWTNGGETTIGRAKINGTGANNSFITGLDSPNSVAIDSKYIYWTQGSTPSTGSIGRANLNGSNPNPNFIPHSAGIGFANSIAVTPNAVYWGNVTGGGTSIGRANLDGTSPNPSFVPTTSTAFCGMAADQNNLYWLDSGLAHRIGRVGLDGSNPQLGFIPVVNSTCGIAVDGSFLYWGASGNSVGRAPVGGGTANNNFIPGATPPGNTTSGVAVNPQYLFWGNSGPTDFIGRSNLNGSAPNASLIPGPTAPKQLAAAPSNKITVNSISKKKKKGTAAVNAKVPGPGQVTLNQTNTPPDVNATAAGAKQVGLTITQASSFKLPVKPTGKTAKKLNKGVKKKGKAKVKVKVFIHFVPTGVAGVPNTQAVTVTLIKQGKQGK
jgi:Low-density lipoprotein receptor repeat class B